MANSLLRLLIPALHILTGECVHILGLWVPPTLENGSQSSAVLDCVYNYTQQDSGSLEVKWYWRHGLQPIYQWLPPNPPQVLAPTFLDHLVPEFSVTENNFTRHRALNLVNLDTSLSGVYSCRVSSNHGDSFRSAPLNIFAKPKRTDFYVEKTKDGEANLTCLAGSSYPQPRLRILRTTEWATLQDLSPWSVSVTSWYNGSFHQRTHITLPVRTGELTGLPYVRAKELLQCEVTIPSTPFKEILYREWTSGERPSTLAGGVPRVQLARWLLASLLLWMWRL